MDFGYLVKKNGFPIPIQSTRILPLIDYTPT